MTDAEREAASLGRRFRTATSAVDVGGTPIELLHPASAEELISQEDFDRDERLPYWADVWPSGQVLARRLGAMDGRGRTLLELGCGAGLVAAAAARAGFAVTATDYYEEALAFTRVNSWRAAGVAVETRVVDWRSFPADLSGFDLVVASDVLYERPYAPLLAYAYARTVRRDGGRGLLADPGRVAAESWLSECAGRGLEVRLGEQVPYAAGPIRQTINLYEVRWPAPRGGAREVRSMPIG